MTAGDYEVALDGGKVVCRNASGRRLKSVPPKIADDPAVVGLRQLVDWPERHERQCLTTAERWMVRSLPVPLAVITGVWPDPAWQAALRDLVVTGAAGRVFGAVRRAQGGRRHGRRRRTHLALGGALEPAAVERQRPLLEEGGLHRVRPERRTSGRRTARRRLARRPSRTSTASWTPGTARAPYRGPSDSV